MYALNYHVPTIGTLLSHFPQFQPLIRDVSRADSDSDELTELHTRARVSSGDYLVTVATELDKIAQGLNAARAPEAPELERMVSELLYVHQNYRLVRK